MLAHMSPSGLLLLTMFSMLLCWLGWALLLCGSSSAAGLSSERQAKYSPPVLLASGDATELGMAGREAMLSARGSTPAGLHAVQGGV